MPFTYKSILLVGATSGIGAGLADKFVAEGSRVIAVGRRQDKLDGFVKKHNSTNAAAIRYDITDSSGSGFRLTRIFPRVVTQYPDLDAVFLNAGIQSQMRLSRPAEFNLASFHHEINVNFTSIVNLAMSFLPHLQAKTQPTSLIITGTHLGLVPAPTIPAYSASKAALTSFVDCLRDQNRHKCTKIIEIYPPVVQSELHDYLGEELGRSLGMPVDQFTHEAYEQLLHGDELIVIGSVATEPRESYIELVEKRRQIYSKLSSVMLARFEL